MVASARRGSTPAKAASFGSERDGVKLLLLRVWISLSRRVRTVYGARACACVCVRALFNTYFVCDTDVSEGVEKCWSVGVFQLVPEQV